MDKNHDFFNKNQKIGFFLFKSDFFDLNRIFFLLVHSLYLLLSFAAIPYKLTTFNGYIIILNTNSHEQSVKSNEAVTVLINCEIRLRCKLLCHTL